MFTLSRVIHSFPSIARRFFLGMGMGAIFVMGGCSGGVPLISQEEAPRLQPLDEVAVVSVRAKKLYQNELGETEVEEATDVRQAVSTITEETERQARRADPRFRAASMQVRDSLFGSFRAASPFSLVEEAAVLQSSAYARLGDSGEDAAKNQGWQASLFATPEGYRPLDADRVTGSSAGPNAAGGLPSAPDGLLFADITYTLVKDRVRRATQNNWEPSANRGTRVRTTLSSGDTVAVDVEATVRIRVIDQQGKTAMTITQTARSDEGFTFVYGEGWTTAEIDGATQRATSSAMEKVTSRLRNNLPRRTLARVAGETDSRASE